MDNHARGLSIRGIGKTYETLSGELVEALTPVDLEQPWFHLHRGLE